MSFLIRISIMCVAVLFALVPEQAFAKLVFSDYAKVEDKRESIDTRYPFVFWSVIAAEQRAERAGFTVEYILSEDKILKNVLNAPSGTGEKHDLRIASFSNTLAHGLNQKREYNHKLSIPSNAAIGEYYLCARILPRKGDRFSRIRDKSSQKCVLINIPYICKNKVEMPTTGQKISVCIGEIDIFYDSFSCSSGFQNPQLNIPFIVTNHSGESIGENIDFTYEASVDDDVLFTGTSKGLFFSIPLASASSEQSGALNIEAPQIQARRGERMRIKHSAKIVDDGSEDGIPFPPNAEYRYFTIPGTYCN